MPIYCHLELLYPVHHYYPGKIATVKGLYCTALYFWTNKANIFMMFLRNFFLVCSAWKLWRQCETHPSRKCLTNELFQQRQQSQFQQKLTASTVTAVHYNTKTVQVLSFFLFLYILLEKREVGATYKKVQTYMGIQYKRLRKNKVLPKCRILLRLKVNTAWTLFGQAFL